MLHRIQCHSKTPSPNTRFFAFAKSLLRVTMNSLQIKPTVFNSIKTQPATHRDNWGTAKQKKSNAHRVVFEFAKHINKQKKTKKK